MGISPESVLADAGVRGLSGTRGQDDGLRREKADLSGCEGVVSDDLHVLAEPGEELVEVVGEAVVIVDEQDHGLNSSL